jgi:DNA modification methylase
MYPAKLVNKLIQAYTKEGDFIYDPFSGRGTTLLEARLLNRRAYASDLNPLSYVITKSKTHSLKKNKIFTRIKLLEKEYFTSKICVNQDDYDYMKTYFSDSVYKQLCFLKVTLGMN